jgi:hypothetical protein
MFILAMTPFCCYEVPSIGFNDFNNVPDAPQRGQGRRKGGGGRSIQQEISRWNMTIP